MPIYDLSYRHWDGPLHGAERRWLVIAEAGIRLLLSYKKFVFLLMLSWCQGEAERFAIKSAPARASSSAGLVG